MDANVPQPLEQYDNVTIEDIRFLKNRHVKSACVITRSGTNKKYHYPGCPATFQGPDLDHKDLSHPLPNLTAFVFDSYKDMHAWAMANGHTLCHVRPPFICTGRDHPPASAHS
eukprot:tig00000367_g24468.t1